MKHLFSALLVTTALTMASCNQKAEVATSQLPDADSTLRVRINCMKTTTPETREKFVELALQLVEQTQSEEGRIEYDLYESLTDANSLMIYETWENQQVLDVHSNGLQTNELVPQMAELASTDLQAFCPATPDTSITTIRLNCSLTVNEENAEAVIALCKELVAASKQDQGCIDYDVFRSMTDPTKLVIFETWASQADLDAHSASEHFTRLVPQIEAEAPLTIESF